MRIALLAITIILFASVSFAQISLNQKLTTEAWDAFNAQNYKLAIAKADTCIDAFELAATRKQDKMYKNEEPQPPKGVVKDPKERDRIFKRGILNDVATCFFIKGQSAERLEEYKVAMTAYQEGAIFTYARTWDPKGWFWISADACEDRLSQIKRKLPGN